MRKPIQKWLIPKVFTELLSDHFKLSSESLLFYRRGVGGGGEVIIVPRESVEGGGVVIAIEA